MAIAAMVLAAAFLMSTIKPGDFFTVALFDSNFFNVFVGNNFNGGDKMEIEKEQWNNTYKSILVVNIYMKALTAHYENQIEQPLTND